MSDNYTGVRGCLYKVLFLIGMAILIFIVEWVRNG